MRAAYLAALLLAAGATLAGCGLHDPYSTATTAASSTSTTVTSSPAATATTAPTSTAPTDDGPRTPPAPAPMHGAVRQTPQAALARYAQLYVNWRWNTIQPTERQLAAISQAQARAQALTGAANAAGQLAQYQVQNAGTVVAVAQGQASERGKWAVVADERTTGTGPYQGLPAVSEVIWATVAHTHQGWVVNGWYPAGATP